MRVFMDANVLFASAISPQGRSAALFILADQDACTLLTSTHAITELGETWNAGTLMLWNGLSI